MALFRYQAVNGAGKTVRGQIEASDAAAAGSALRQQGLFPMRIDPVERRAGGLFGALGRRHAGTAAPEGAPGTLGGPGGREGGPGTPLNAAFRTGAVPGERWAPGREAPVSATRVTRGAAAQAPAFPGADRALGAAAPFGGSGEPGAMEPGRMGPEQPVPGGAPAVRAAGGRTRSVFPGRSRDRSAGVRGVFGGVSGSPAGSEGTAKRTGAARFGLRLGEGRVKVQTLAVFCRQFATLVRAGVPAARSVEILAAQSENRTLKRTLEAVAAEVRQGTALQRAFAAHPSVFPALFIHMVGAGEFSGQLDLMLERAALFYERERATRQKITSALMYPAVVLTIALGVSVFLLTSVIPTFAQTFAQQGVTLPLPTRITLGLSHFLTERWYLALALVAAVVGGAVAGARTAAGKEWIGRLSLGLPVFGGLNRKHAVAQFSRTFATLVRAAVPILDGLELTKKVMGNVLYRAALTEAQEELRAGRTMAEALGRHPRLFPPMVVQMIAVGEETGTLDDLLDKLADFYESDVQEMAARLGALLEPMMILFLAVIVGLIILSVYLPMFQMMNFVGS